MKTKSSAKFYLALTVFSLVGQVAWVVENMYFNVFLYNMFHAGTEDISRMVFASAVAAALTTIVMGALSDRIGKRKLLICLGYILWGLSILTFSFLRMDVLTRFVPELVAAASLGVSLTILMDCVMTFFGSTANDACFNAWLTDSTNSTNRGKAEGINSMMPLVAILVVFGSFLAFDLKRSGSWTIIFLIIGISVSLIGVLGFFLIKEPELKPEKRPFWKTILHAFTPAVIVKNKILYAALLSFTVFGISIQVFMPYLILYYTEGLKMDNYVLIMAPAIILASVLTAFYGKYYDKVKFKKAIILPLALLGAGYILLFLFRATPLVFLGSLLMMSGYLTGCAVFGAMVRDYTPAGEAGQFQGPRIVFQVLIPGTIGPMIGAAVLKNADTVINSDGTESFIPNEKIFLAALVVLVFTVLSLLFVNRLLDRAHELLQTVAESGKQGAQSNTKLSEAPWNAYPRPQLQRDSFLNLNGCWELAISGQESVNEYPEQIIVPYPLEALLSIPEAAGSKEERAEMVARRIKQHKKGAYLHYRKTFETPQSLNKAENRLLLHIGAADCITTVKVNGTQVAEHSGGYLPIDVDVTDYIKAAGSNGTTGNTAAGTNTLEIRVMDNLDHRYPYGKQTKHPKGMWYTQTSGIWQTVWLEQVPEQHIKGLRITTSGTQAAIHITGGTPEKILLFQGKETRFSGDNIIITPEEPKRWSPEQPTLYEFTIVSGQDRVQSYFALRTLTTEVHNGYKRLCLNGAPYFFHGVLDQGYWPDGTLTAPDAESYVQDIQNMKALGFNTLRKHIKIEPERFYYECDRLGMVVWQDMVNNGRYRWLRDTALPTIGCFRKEDSRFPVSQEEKDIFLQHAKETVEHLYNHPCICLWTIFNEGWGQFDSDAVYEQFKTWDSSRFVDVTSGWFRMKKNPVESLHIYFKPVVLPKTEKPLLLTEFGGYAVKLPGHVWQATSTYGYRFYKTTEELQQGLSKLYRKEIIPAIGAGLCASIYTQLSDVEWEINGLYSYDRAICKADPKAMQDIAEQCREAMQR